MHSKSGLVVFLLCVLYLFIGKIHASDEVIYQSKKIQQASKLYIDADSLFNNFEFFKADKLYKRNLDILIKSHKRNSQEVSFGLYKLSNCEYELGNYKIVDSLLDDALEIQSRIDTTSLMYARLLYRKSQIGNALCDCKEIIPIAQQAVALLEQNLGDDAVEVAQALEVLGYVLAHDYKYDDAKIVLRRSLQILENKFGPNSPKLTKSLSYLSRIYLIQYDSESGLKLLDRAIEILQENDIDSQRRLAEVYYFKTYLLYVKSDYSTAQEVSQKGYEIAQKVFGENHTFTADFGSILGRTYIKLGKYELAEPLFLKIKKVFEEKIGNQNLVMYYSYVNLGELFIAQSRFDEAEYYFSKILNFPNIKESMRIGILTNLSEIYLAIGDLEKAEKLCNEIITFRTKQFGKTHPSVALSLKTLAKIYMLQNNFIKSQKTYNNILEIFKQNYGENSLYTASTLYDFAELYNFFGMHEKAKTCLSKALIIRTQNLLDNNPSVANTYLKLAETQLYLNEQDSAFNNMLKGLDGRRDFIDHVFKYASSEQKLLYTKDHPLIYDPLLAMSVKQLSEPVLKTAIEMILRGKALVIDALSRDKETAVCEGDEEVSNLVSQYADICTRISAIALSPKQNFNINLEESNIQTLYRLRDSLEAELSLMCANFGSQKNMEDITLNKVAQSLSYNMLFIDYIKYHPDIQNSKIAHYIGYTLDSDAHITLLDLGEAEKIDSLIYQARLKIQESQVQVFSQKAQYLEDDLKVITRKLFSKLIRPFINEISRKQKITIAPDSHLNLIPFELFVNDLDQYLIEAHEISYVTSGRDVMKQYDKNLNGNGLLIVAAPDFGSKNNSQKFIQSTILKPRLNSEIPIYRSGSSGDDCLDNAFPDLQYSKKEGEELLEFFKHKFKDEKTKVYYGKDATSQVLTDLQNPPRYLHLSTHGFFCEGSENNSIKNPLLKSGLAFTGANFAISDDFETPFSFDDGLLTALEVTGLNLVGTELVTLSACETGIGETVNGEGVYGLRRAFQIAGAKSILMSMWKIPDKETSEFMCKFYKKLFNGQSKQHALRESALEVLKETREKYHHGHPYLWSGFILTGNPN